MRKAYTREKLARFYSWNDYGIDKDRMQFLKCCCQDDAYKNQVIESAYLAEPYIAKWLVESVTQNKSYEDIEFDKRLGRIPCGRTDFYGYRRRFYSLFNMELSKNGTDSGMKKDKIKGEV